MRLRITYARHSTVAKAVTVASDAYMCSLGFGGHECLEEARQNVLGNSRSEVAARLPFKLTNFEYGAMRPAQEVVSPGSLSP